LLFHCITSCSWHTQSLNRIYYWEIFHETVATAFNIFFQFILLSIWRTAALRCPCGFNSYLFIIKNNNSNWFQFCRIRKYTWFLITIPTWDTYLISTIQFKVLFCVQNNALLVRHSIMYEIQVYLLLQKFHIYKIIVQCL